MAKVEFAPDGKHWYFIKKGKLETLWDYFILNKDVRQQMMLNSKAKFRLIGDQGKIIGTLPRRKLKDVS